MLLNSLDWSTTIGSNSLIVSVSVYVLMDSPIVEYRFKFLASIGERLIVNASAMHTRDRTAQTNRAVIEIIFDVILC
jgi:hypothetical protein